jgi:hypothetical protein
MGYLFPVARCGLKALEMSSHPLLSIVVRLRPLCPACNLQLAICNVRECGENVVQTTKSLRQMKTRESPTHFSLTKFGHVGKVILKNRTGETTMALKVEIKDNKLFIEIDLEKPTPSSSGKTLVVASTHGNTVTNAEVDGKPLTIGLNAYIKR